MIDLTRRDFVNSSAKFFGALSLMGLIPGEVAARSPESKTLVVVFLRGGNDGVNTIIPYGDDEYYNLRPRISIRESDVIKLSGSDILGLHPRLEPLKEIYDAGHLAIFPAAHNDYLNRSHFESQDMLESGLSSITSDGWLNRFLKNNTGDNNLLRAVSLTSNLAKVFQGPYSVSNFADLGNFKSSIPENMLLGWSSLYAAFNSGSTPLSTLISGSADSLFKDLNKINEINSVDYIVENGAEYPMYNSTANKFRDAARLIKNSDIEVIGLDIGGYDTHTNQRNRQDGLHGTLAGSMKAFYKDLGPERMKNVTMLVYTEFGRTAKENASAGTDHGNATSYMVMGGNINGGLYGAWPGLAASQMENGRYLKHSVDCGDIISELLVKFLGAGDINNIFPNHSYTPLNFIA